MKNNVSPDGRHPKVPLWLEIERKLALVGGPPCRCVAAHRCGDGWRWTDPDCPEHGHHTRLDRT